MMVNHIMFILNVLRDSCTIKYYIVTENIFVCIVYSFLPLQKLWKCFEINCKQMIIMPKKVKLLNLKIMRGK